MSTLVKRRPHRKLRHLAKRKKRKMKDYALCLKNLKTYPFLVTATQPIQSLGAGNALFVGAFLNYPTYIVNTANTVAQTVVRTGWFNNNFAGNADAIFDEYKVEWMKVEVFPTYTDQVVGNATANANTTYFYLAMDRDNTEFPTTPTEPEIMNLESNRRFPLTSKRASIVMRNRGILERGYYNTNFINPASLPNNITNIQPVAKRAGVMFYAPDTNIVANLNWGQMVITWAIRFRGTGGIQAN